MPDAEAQNRALWLFEMVSERPGERAEIVAGEAAEVLTALRDLEAASGRARLSFPTEDDARPRRRPMPLPERIGAYRLVSPLGEGGMGMIFAAERCDGLFEHRVAIKLIHPDRFTDRALSRFADERRLLARLVHPGIARLLDGGVTDEGWPFIVMELVEGVPLDVAAAPLPLSHRVRLVEQVCDAVAAAHAALIVHGDIKPANVLVDAARRAHLVDFGLARLVDDPVIEEARPVTAAFASPAQRGGAAPQVTDDVFALGMLLRATCSAERNDPLCSDLTDVDIAAIVRCATADDPAARYRSVDMLAEELRRWRSRRPVAARGYSWTYVMGRFLSRNRRGVVVAAIAAVLAFLALAGWQTARQRETLYTARTNDLRTLARYQLFVIAARLEHQPRAVLMRRTLATEAEAVLTRALSGGTPSADLRREAARGYRLLAATEGAPDRPSLGDTAAARASLANAARLVAGDETTQGRVLRAQILLDQALIAGNAGQIEGALSWLREAQSLTPPSDRDLADDVDLLRADTMIWNGDYRAAQRLAEAIGARRPGAPWTLDEVLRRDRIRDREAEAAFYAGDVTAAVAGYRAAEAGLVAASGMFPDQPAIAWALARQRWNVGTSLLELGRAGEAIGPLRKARALMAAQVDADPDDQIARRRLRIYDLALAQADAALGHTDAAIRALRAGVAERKAWWRRSPGSVERARDVAIGLAALGDVYAAAGRRGPACATYAEVHTLHASLAARGRLSKLDAGYFGQLVNASRARLACTVS